jgi:hypothetical protein
VNCSGAAITSLSAPQPTSDGTNPAQPTALTPATTLVTLGIGGNDLDWATVLTRCVEVDLAPQWPSRRRCCGGVQDTRMVPAGLRSGSSSSKTPS